ncbi:MAG: glycosyltransferase [Selenomonadaceae bacterium]|nr:glycosyltransferase [Selenomonadaceae bacterium]
MKVGKIGKLLSKIIKPKPKIKEEVFLRIDCEDSFEYTLDLEELSYKQECTLMGIRIVALSEGAIFHGGEYFGAFDTEREVKVGITICTFKREKYLLPNLERLKTLTDRNPNINVMVIDNGQTLEEVNAPELQIIHNPNFGGSGGFARGIMEQVRQKRNTHILLMDDDVLLEMSSFDRLYAILRHLKPEHQKEFFAGAMMILDDPLIQHENTAYLGKSLGHEFNLKKKFYLLKNEKLPDKMNKYAAWWFCCIPVDVVKEIGYPLPVFIKCDDVEYSLRNNQDVMSMNGVGVWHESAEEKWNSVTDYFATRNYLMMFHFAKGKGRFSFLKECFLQITKRILRRDGVGMRMLELALKDLKTGLTGITSVKSDEQFAAIRKFVKEKPFDSTIISVIIHDAFLSFIYFLRYGHYDKEYKSFRKEKLSDQRFWRSFLGIDDES